MKIICTSLVAAPLLFAACTYSLPDKLDGGLDLSVGDLSVGDLADSGCTTVASWPALLAAGGFDPSQGDTFILAARQVSEPKDVLAVEDWHAAAGPDGGAVTYPKLATFKAGDTYATCDVCVRLLEGCTAASGCARGYFAQGGTMTVARADSNPTVGRMTVTGANLKLVEWQFPTTDADGGLVGDVPVVGGRCWQVGAVALDVPWDHTPDGGTVSCHPVVNELLTGTTASASDEFIELYNPCATPADLGNWTLVHRTAANNGGGGDTTLITFPAGTSLAANGYLVGVNAAVTTRAHDFTYTPVIPATGGAIGLRDSSAALVDSVAFQNLTTANTLTEGTPAPNPPKNGSIGRLPNGADINDNSVDFAVTTMMTPGSANQ